MKYRKVYGLYGHLYGGDDCWGPGFPLEFGRFSFLHYDPNDRRLFPTWDGNVINSWGPYFYSKLDRKKWYKKALKVAKDNPDYMDEFDWAILHYMGHCKLKPYWYKVEDK